MSGIWGSLTDAVSAVAYSDSPSTPNGVVEGEEAPAKVEEEGTATPGNDGNAEVSGENAAADDGGFWGSISSIADGIKSAVDEQIAVQAAALEEEQAKVSAARKPAEAQGLPWATATEAIQGQILALSEASGAHPPKHKGVTTVALPVQDERPFRQEPPSKDIFEFDLHESAAQAMAACEWDDRLQQMRYKLVPAIITDEQFWTNYFYRARLIQVDDDFPLQPLASIIPPALTSPWLPTCRKCPTCFVSSPSPRRNSQPQ